MVRQRLWSLLLGLVLLATGVAPVLGADGGRSAGERPLTTEERRLAERRITEAERYLAAVDGVGGPTTQLVCPVPTGTTTAATQPQAGVEPQHACIPPSGFLSVEARDQLKAIYCGPAVGQVISNYAWAMGAGQNKYTQAQIAAWMRTDIVGSTNAPDLANGLNRATGGSPRQPAGWVWVVVDLRDRNGNGLVGDELHGFTRSNISNSRMPLAIPVKPHEPGAKFWLSSWPTAVPSLGHWIAVYGWWDLYNGTDKARIYYADSSRDEGGATGKFSDPTRHLAIMIMAHTKRLVW